MGPKLGLRARGGNPEEDVSESTYLRGTKRSRKIQPCR
jgi:hypothetical protein